MGRKLVAPTRGAWTFVLYPEAAEGGGSFRSARAGSGGDRPSAYPELSDADAARRARSKLRRYCAANGLNRMGDVTYAGAGCHDERQLRADLADCFRKLRRRIGKPFPYVWVPEWHKTDHGLHAHFAVGRFIQRQWIVEAWGHGFIYIHLHTDLPVGSTALAEARRAARYLAKYVGKDFAHEHRAGLHRYEVAQGFQPRGITLDGETADEVLGWAASYMGGEPERVWRSHEAKDWAGPPAVWASWA